MRRLVYAPKAYVYIQTDDGVFNISDLVTAGEVHRVIDQVSTASVTFQNPGFTFTQPGNPTFRPMDKITIFLQRLPGFPVQAFTGYIDDAPYYQMYPGTITLTASCTLKRLNYTYFDPGLPFMIEFLKRYGWDTAGDGTLQNSSALSGAATSASDMTPQERAALANSNTATADAGQGAAMSELMFAVLKHIAGWDPDELYIEELPDALVTRIDKIYTALTQTANEAEANFNLWLKEFIGAGSSGGGGTTGNATSGISLSSLDQEQNKVLDTLLTVGEQMASPKLMLAAVETALVEDNLHNSSKERDADSQNWRQERRSVYGLEWARTGGALNIEASARRFYEECKQFDSGQSAGDLAGAVQRPAAEYRYRYGAQEANAKKLISEWQTKKNGGSSTTTASDGSDTTTKSSSTTKAADGMNSHSDGSSSSSKDNTTSSTTRYDAIVAKANLINDANKAGNWPYSYNRPPVGHSDCSSTISLLLDAAGYKGADSWPSTDTIVSAVGLTPGTDPGGRFTIYNKETKGLGPAAGHVWALVGGRAFSTSSSHPGSGPGWVDNYYAKDNPESNGFKPYHVTGLDEPHDIPKDASTSVGGGDTTTGSTGTTDALAAAKAGAVFTTLNFPQSLVDAESVLLQGDDARGKSLMNDQPLMPFVEQLAKGSLRSFMSLPNGDFYAFHPDYFGSFGTAPYWEIDDIEILDGGITLSDKNLVTHVYVIGNVWNGPADGTAAALATTGVVNILNAGTADFLNIEPAKATPDPKKKSTSKTQKADETELEPFLGDTDAAIKFLTRYGARPYVEQAPFIRSHLFETFYAFQTFMLAWSRQFLSTFSFTFMPELYPGGIVVFKERQIQMYVDEVHHSWDYSSGFTTQANLSAPASTTKDGKGISRGMIRAQ